MFKEQLRIIYKQKRLELPVKERLKLDDLLLIQLQRLSLEEHVRVIMSFWPMENHGEMNTHIYTRYLEHVILHAKIAYPVVNFSGSKLHAILVDDETEFVENKYGIMEPEEGETVPPQEIDVVFVPLLAFDEQGYRVGYGKGYYDRFLQQCRADVVKIGFSYFMPVDKIDDTHQFDVPLNYCITPEKIYEF